jgi:hypothetical protein
MTLVDMSKIIFNPLITILFIVDTGAMAPICVRMLGSTPMHGIFCWFLVNKFLTDGHTNKLIITFLQDSDK